MNTNRLFWIGQCAGMAVAMFVVASWRVSEQSAFIPPPFPVIVQTLLMLAPLAKGVAIAGTWVLLRTRLWRETGRVARWILFYAIDLVASLVVNAALAFPVYVPLLFTEAAQPFQFALIPYALLLGAVLSWRDPVTVPAAAAVTVAEPPPLTPLETSRAAAVVSSAIALAAILFAIAAVTLQQDKRLFDVIGQSIAATPFTLLLALVYFAPAIVALRRVARRAPRITLVNAVIGWTVVGWFVCLVWATIPVARSQGVRITPGWRGVLLALLAGAGLIVAGIGFDLVNDQDSLVAPVVIIAIGCALMTPLARFWSRSTLVAATP